MDNYKSTLVENPRLAAEVEAIIRWSSYLIATRKSQVFGELLTSCANLFNLCNTVLLRESKLKLNLKECATQLKISLSVIQSVELLAEIYGKTHGAATKWAIITIIQVAKAAIKLILLLIYKQGISRSQPISQVDFVHYSEIVKLQAKFADQLSDSDDESSSIERITHEQSFKLKSSGRKLRSITESPPRDTRLTEKSNRKQLTAPEKLQKRRLTLLLDRYLEQRPADLTERQLYGELIHIARPIAHLIFMRGFGPKSWMSFFVSMVMDVSSIYMIRPPLPLSTRRLGPSLSGDSHELQTVPKNYNFNYNERMELGQRASSLLMYLLRSPFFDEFTKKRAIDGLASTAEGIPLIGSFVASFFNYIPEWQEDYFRIWSS